MYNDDIFTFEQNAPATGLAGVLAGVKSVISKRGASESHRQVAGHLISLESLDAAGRQELSAATSSLHASLEGICSTSLPGTSAKAGLKNTSINSAQMKAALYAGILGGDIKGAANASLKSSHIATETLNIVAPEAPGLDQRRYAAEAYDEQATSTSVAFSVAYNLAAARQDEFGEALFPTVVIPPDQAGLMMSIDLVLLQNDIKRKIDGTVADWHRYNVIRAQVKPSLLQNDQTNLVPVYRDESKPMFVDEAILPHSEVTMSNGEKVATSALAMGGTLDLLGISQTDALLDSGAMDVTDSIDPSVALKALYLNLKNAGNTTHEVIKFGTMDLPGTAFNYAVQGNFRDMNLNANNLELHVNVDTKTVTGGPSALLAPLSAGGAYDVRLAITVSGSINLQIGQVSLFTNKVKVLSVRNANGDVSLTAGPGKTIADIFVGAEFLGYDLDARRSNLNRRQRGQLVDTTTMRQFYQVPLLAPVTVPRPHAAGDSNDAKDLAALVFTTHVRTSNAAVDKLLATATLLKTIAGATSYNKLGDKIDVLGLSRYLLDPYYDEQNYVGPDVVDSIKSFERSADIQASLVNMLRDMVYRMYQKTGFKPAADSQNGGMSAPPTVIIATDQVIGRYLTVTGDLRTLGDQFPVKIVTTPNELMYGKIFITFGDFTTAEAGVPNVLHFGTMQWRPELTVILPTHRDGGNSKEISVSPSFRHHVNLPILGLINVTGIEDVVNQKVAVNMNAV